MAAIRIKHTTASDGTVGYMWIECKKGFSIDFIEASIEVIDVRIAARKNKVRLKYEAAEHNPYATALKLYQDFVESPEYHSDINFKLWCQKRLSESVCTDNQSTV